MTPADERTSLTPWARAFEAVYGWAPVFDDFDAVPGGFTLTVRPAVEPIELLGGTGHFRHRPALVAHVKSLGFAWTDANRIVTAPSPETFNALLPSPDGYRVRVLRDPRRNLALGAVLTCYLEGCVPAHVAGGSLYPSVYADPKNAPGRGDLRFHFASFAHDLSVHALNYHLVPRACIEDLATRIGRAMPERVALWREPEAPGPLTLGMFFDNDLNRYCYAVWARSEAPSDFAKLFAESRNLAQLTGCLDQRIDETLRGLGDVPSGDSRDLPPLAPCEFRVG